MEIHKNTRCLESEQEYLHCCFTLVVKEITLAKVTVYINPYHKIEGEQAATIGFLTCVDDDKVFSKLLNAVMEEVSLLNIAYIIGPMDGSTWNTYRLVTSPQPDPFLLEVITPRYHIDLYKKYGFTTLAKYLSTQTHEIVDNWEKLEKRYHDFTKAGVVFEPFNLEDATSEFEAIAHLCLNSFAGNLLFSPIETGQFVEKMMPTLPLINPRYTIVAKHQNKAVGFIFCYQDLQDKNEKAIVVKTLARDLDDRYKGIGSVLSSLAMRNVKADGFTKGIHALMVDYNTSAYISSNFEANFLRSYELLSYKIVH